MPLTYHQQDTLRTQGAFHVQSFQSIIQENYITIYQFFSRCIMLHLSLIRKHLIMENLFWFFIEFQLQISTLLREVHRSLKQSP